MPDQEPGASALEPGIGVHRLTSGDPNGHVTWGMESSSGPTSYRMKGRGQVQYPVHQQTCDGYFHTNKNLAVETGFEKVKFHFTDAEGA